MKAPNEFNRIVRARLLPTMSAKIYISAALTETARVIMLQNAFIEAGHTIAYDWATDAFVSREEAPRTAWDQMKAVMKSEVFIFIPSTEAAANIELGLALEKRSRDTNFKIIGLDYPEDHTNVFYELGFIQWI